MDDWIETYASTPQSKRYSIAFLVGMVLCCLYYVMVHQDAEDRLRYANQNFKKQQAQVVKKREYVQNMAKYEARFKQLQQELAHARSVLPDTADVPQLLSHLGNKAHETGLQIDFFEPQSVEDKGFYSEIIFGMKLRGSFHEIATFVDAIGKMDRIVNVAGVSMTNPKSVNQKIIVQGAFTIKTYRFKKDG